MTRELILKRYERGMTVEQIAAVDNLTLAHVEEVISSSDVQPVERKQGMNAQAGTITDEALTERLKAGETRYAIERSLDMTPGTLSSRVKRIQHDMNRIQRDMNRVEKKKDDAVTIRPTQRKDIDLALVEKLLDEGKSVPDISREMGVSDGTIYSRINGNEALKAKSLANGGRKRNGRKPNLSDEDVTAYFKQGWSIAQIASKSDTSHSNIKKRLKRMGLLETNQSTLAAQEVAVTTECDGFAENFTIAALMKEEEEMTEAIAEVKQETEERNEPNDKWVHFVANQIDNARVKTKFDVVQEGKKFIKRTEVRFVIEEVL